MGVGFQGGGEGVCAEWTLTKFFNIVLQVILFLLVLYFVINFKLHFALSSSVAIAKELSLVQLEALICQGLGLSCKNRIHFDVSHINSHFIQSLFFQKVPKYFLSYT